MMEENVFPLRAVARKLERFVEARLHTDGKGAHLDSIHALQKKLAGTLALPVYVILDPATQAPLAKREGAPNPFAGPEEVFMRFLDAGLAAWGKTGGRTAGKKAND